ncbi:Signal transduction histidine kinase [Agromyces sp. CF514]|uniref:sensor histidine kinase n=1 Tax=Agromyces sp. CF514 TaxID=1881031 RepID=UPI0008E1AF77|nr:histidine kinase [Agromyces sp. CF514]SFR90405.1 Signal transduction histidine kinase [Agromyces sp. CF514]
MSATVPPPVIDGVEWVRPHPDRRAYRHDVVLALVLAAAAGASVMLYRITGITENGPWWGAALWVVGMTLPLAARRRWPEIVAIVASAVFVAGSVAGVVELLFSNIALFIAIYTVGAWGRSRVRANLVRGAIVIGMFGWLFWGLITSSFAQDFLPELDRDGLLSPFVAYGLINVLTNLLYFGGAWYFGDAAYRSARARAELEQRTAELAAERERTRSQAVALERLRIARELHDVVAHHVSVIGVQAGAARRVLAKDPDAAAASLSSIESSARDAVEELHGLLGTLRGAGDTGAIEIGTGAAASASSRSSDDEPATTSTSTRGIDRIEELVAESAASGLPVTFSVVGDGRPVSAVVELSAYRIAQEALTNVRKHAGSSATAEVRVRWDPDALEVEVTNTGTATRVAAPSAASASSIVRPPVGDRAAGGATGQAGGLGQLGMRERVGAAGGSLEVGPRARGGYLVRARFPLRREEARS